MENHYNVKQTASLYALSAVLFAFYGGRICPMLETLTLMEVATHVSITFLLMFGVRHLFLANHYWINNFQHAKLDTLLFALFGFALAVFYNTMFQFPLDSNLKVLCTMTLFGFFSGTLLQLNAKYVCFDETLSVGKTLESFQGERQSMVKQMIWLIALLVACLTTMLSFVALKDVFWLENNPARIADGTGKVSIIKEFAYIAVVLGGYTIAIMVRWSKLMKKVLLSQESSLIRVSEGKIDTRLPVFEYNELGSMAALTNQMLDSLQDSQDEVVTTRDVAITSLAALAESRDNETGAHILRTQEYVKALACQLASKPEHQSLLTAEYIDLLYKSAPLHDVGKVGVPDSVLLKPGKLTDEEFEVMKQHPVIGAQALSIAEKQMGSSSFLRIAKEISLTHHEKWDGSGYPVGLSGSDIPLSGRLMALADVYDALISKRVYKPAFSHEKAKAIILEGNGKHFDPQIVEAFVAIEDTFVQIAATYKDSASEETPSELMTELTPQVG
ncbi:HD domain-containing phosphohydrolase [Vibrio sp. SCSIO 43136]|uniref:HD-GYP domain-containing protein n=1 Tax=Vibrio sp. SCSIO 43136 TaxID=2819101 RepID=UPI002075A714|nr:HD domain-containing phosphohydrolase [Vibrio sp. SCSIO 43136]USD66429.1 HD domain-containing protein [Vibrio sp. SCSIO 43136]